MHSLQYQMAVHRNKSHKAKHTTNREYMLTACMIHPEFMLKSQFIFLALSKHKRTFRWAFLGYMLIFLILLSFQNKFFFLHQDLCQIMKPEVIGVVRRIKKSNSNLLRLQVLYYTTVMWKVYGQVSESLIKFMNYLLIFHQEGVFLSSVAILFCVLPNCVLYI